jgi:ATP-dependent RNA helicase DDX56/DBP9
MISQFYHIGDDISRMIIVYVLFKLKFLSGKTLILVKNIDEVFKFQLFLERIGVKSFQIYNPEDPKNLRYYNLTIFNTGVLSILVSTP